ncbi:D-amino-acid transaminase [Amphiplicatus metriothermophilus]|uniref:Probable branched-chain-amino-acid aminotransferase n=1 Tax=Amphiplicatus metriothermophilus TaxID=1519374 RepID=A0A239PYX1_9PROT|nr:D-amino-acid transaminase [Amphiplicatus metriothermophilus]MBB5519966.1 D-alanine transaminase [Amphiplicatus metriothermophilus]SNT74867.1 D-alanine aminotransferase apoenzyme [Amphiplicatus metriothermophilus]
MPRIAYVNGAYVPLAEAAVNVEDRGYQFADGVYEVCLVVGGRFWDEEGHLDRLDRSLAALEIAPPVGRRALRLIASEVLRRNRLRDALVYIQITRGVAARNHAFPMRPVPPSLVVTAKRFDLEKSERLAAIGVSVVTAPDIRWGRADIKSVSLLPNVLAKQAAAKAGATEAWLVRDGKVTEGASSNAWIVTEAGEIVTHPATHEILSGITRRTVIDCAEALQLKVVERPFSAAEALRAQEAFLTSATNLVMPVVAIDGRKIGGGRPGPMARRLREAYIRHCAGR